MQSNDINNKYDLSEIDNLFFEARKCIKNINIDNINEMLGKSRELKNIAYSKMLEISGVADKFVRCKYTGKIGKIILSTSTYHIFVFYPMLKNKTRLSKIHDWKSSERLKYADNYNND